MNKDKVINAVKRYTEESVWYTFKNVYFDGMDKEGAFYFRTIDYVIKAVSSEESIEIYLAKEPLYERYDFDFYYFEYETTLPLD